MSFSCCFKRVWGEEQGLPGFPGSGWSSGAPPWFSSLPGVREVIASSPLLVRPCWACDCHVGAQSLQGGSTPHTADTVPADPSPGLTAFPGAWAALVHLGFRQGWTRVHGSPWAEAPGSPWSLSGAKVTHPRRALVAVRPAAGQTRYRGKLCHGGGPTVAQHRASPSEGMPSAPTGASQPTASSPGVFKNSKKNKGLSGAAVFSDSSHNAPKNPYCSCRRHRAVAGYRPLTHLAAEGQEGPPGV